ncbi:MAG: NAD(P)H-dependent oxidoreductase, partial [Proteobacteria bacterium]|nr:NAD(P)H-dependent oxidoreductase [Pseudomonadota bacterium]
MKIAIISGSPRGKNSSTRRHTEYIKKTYPEHDYSELSVGRKIIRLEKNDDLLNSYFDEIAKSDAVIWSFPVYVFIAPSQVVRFVELIHKRGRQDVFEGK